MLAEIDDRVAPLVRAMEIAADLHSGARSVYETALSQCRVPATSSLGSGNSRH
jgi:hypothetical protein